MTHRCAIVAILSALILGSCGRNASMPQAKSESGELLILAAASVGGAVEDVAKAYTEKSGVPVKVSAAGSNALAQQIDAGAPGDLFLSADEAWADEVMDKKHGAERVDLLGNTLVMIVPAGNPGHIRSPHDIAQNHVEHIALAGEDVPAGRYAERALKAMGMWGSVERKIVRAENVRFALAYVERGEAQAGVVYATDATAAGGKVQVVFSFPPETHTPIVYPLVLLEAGAKRDEARELWTFMRGPEAAAIFERHGFRVLEHAARSTSP